MLKGLLGEPIKTRMTHVISYIEPTLRLSGKSKGLWEKFKNKDKLISKRYKQQDNLAKGERCLAGALYTWD